MSYPGLIDDHPYEARETEHREYHIGENIFQPSCGFCQVEKCGHCKGRGMTEDCREICRKCDGRGRII